VCVYACVRGACVCTYMHTYIHTYLHIHTHMFTGMQEPNSYTATILAPSSSTTNTLPAITSPSSGDGEYSGFQDEESMTHEAEEEGWHFTEDDDQRSQLLVDDETLACNLKSGIRVKLKSGIRVKLKSGIRVKLFEANNAVKMKRISLRLVDAHLHAICVHPTQLSQQILEAFLRGKGLQEHVKHVVDEKLLKCVSDGGPNPTQWQKHTLCLLCAAVHHACGLSNK
jgi:hypothetical protein